MKFAEAKNPLRPRIEALLLEGLDVVEAAQAARASVCYVRTIKRELKDAGRLAGRNVG